VRTDPLAAALAAPERLARQSTREWEWLIGHARTARLIARLALRIDECCGLDTVPPGPRRHLAWALCEWEAQVRTLRWDVDFIGRALERVDTPVVLLKGAAYVMAGLPPARGRLFADIDIMVRRDRIGEVEQALLVTGWADHALDAYDQRYYRTWMHEIPPLQHIQRNSELDVHHAIAPLTARHYVASELLFPAARKLDLRGNFFVLAPADMLLHSIIHLMQEGEFDHALRDLLDIDDLFRHFGRDPAFWPALAQRAEQHRLGRPLYYAVRQARAFLDTPMPEDFLAAIARFRPNPASGAIMDAVFGAGMATESPDGQRGFADFSRWLLYVRGHYMRMPLRLLLPHLMRKGWRRGTAR